MQTANIVPIVKHELVEVVVRDITQTTILLPDVNNLRNKEITGIEAFRVASVAVSPNSRVVVADAIFNKAFLTLIDCENDEDLSQIPLPTLDFSENIGKVKWFADKVIDISKCKIDLSSAAGLVLDTCFLLSFYYKD